MPDEQLLELRGSVEDIIFRNTQNGYSVLTLDCDGIVTTAVGSMTDVSVGDNLRLVGIWKVHPGYGEQFAFRFYEHEMPSTTSSILKYLSSGAVKGVRRSTAKKLVETFGEHTLEIMQNHPERLSAIKGISPDKAQKISAEIKRVFGMKEVMLYLEKFHISALEAVRIWKNFGDSSIHMIEENPYVLCSESINVPFERADAIAAAMERSESDGARIRAGIIYIIQYNAGNGHTCLPLDKLLSVAASFLKIDTELVSAEAAAMIDDASLILDDLNGRRFVFLPNVYKSEMYCAERILLMRQFPAETLRGMELALENFEQAHQITYADLQRKAITEAMSGGLLILTGGPGTGKTTTLNAILELYKQCGLKVLLAAPTGRAAQRMSEVTGSEAKTIHRLLEVEWDPDDKPRFTRNERNMLDCDALILDEMSMVDTALFESVLRALPLGCRLIMGGDSDQLPSVGAGNVLGDLIASGQVPVVALSEIFRQSMESLIVTNAHKIVHGEMPEIRKTDNDFFFMSYPDKMSIMETIANLCSSRLPSAYGFSPLQDIQVLCPGRKGELGVTEINKKLQQVLNPPDEQKAEVRMPVYIFREGDKVMQTKNNYNLPWEKDDGTSGAGIFNGDIGIIESIDEAAKSAEIRFDDKLVSYNTDNLLNVELAYATTVHKSQGNEFNAVVMPMYYGPPQLYYRNLLYTAVTRAKKLLVLVGNISTLQKMVANTKRTARYSGLGAFLERGGSHAS